VTQGFDFPAFFQATASPLAGYLRRMGASQAIAEDAVQDAFEALVASGGLAWDAARAKAFVYRAATNAYVDGYRRRKREVQWDAMPPASEPEAPPASEDDITASPAWRSLTARQRQLLWLAHAEEFTHKDIARICGIAEGSVRVLLFRAREAFRSFGAS
jgi:RNA polymerase sigma-70 factor (ECF subfamily)